MNLIIIMNIGREWWTVGDIMKEEKKNENVYTFIFFFSTTIMRNVFFIFVCIKQAML